MNAEDGVVMRGKRAEIDTRAPFQSVKEAVTLFGEKVLARELYPTKLREVTLYQYDNHYIYSFRNCALTSNPSRAHCN